MIAFKGAAHYIGTAVAALHPTWVGGNPLALALVKVSAWPMIVAVSFVLGWYRNAHSISRRDSDDVANDERIVLS